MGKVAQAIGTSIWQVIDELNVLGRADGRRACPAPSASAAPQPVVDEEAAIPPAGNTGGKVTFSRLGGQNSVADDWLNVVLPAGQREAALALVAAALGESRDVEHGLHGYNRMTTWETGGLLAWAERLDHCLLSLNGDSLELFDLEHLFELVKGLHALGGHSTRIDVRFDDFTRELLSMEKIHQAANAGDFCGFKIHREERQKYRDGTLTEDKHRFGASGKMGSGRMVVFYDKGLESKGERDCVRMEARFFKEHAAAVFAMLATAPDVGAFTSIMRGVLGDSIDFRNRGNHRHLDRMERLAWWQTVLDHLEELPVVVSRSKPPLQRSLEYHRECWSVSLALFWEICESKGLDADAVLVAYVKLIIDKGKRKLTDGYRPGARALGLDIPALLDMGN